MHHISNQQRQQTNIAQAQGMEFEQTRCPINGEVLCYPFTRTKDIFKVVLTSE